MSGFRPIIFAFSLLFAGISPALACGFGNRAVKMVPPEASIDENLSNANLSESDVDQINALKSRIVAIRAANDEPKVRVVDEEAMLILGYKKVWLRCGSGSFAREKLKAR
jgi:hypothetical protein